jgi:acetyl-CoA synthetase
VLVVETNNLTEETQKELLGQIKAQVQPYAIPRKIFCIPEFPRTENGKINRKALKEFIRNTSENTF